ncbi:hypothetical protein [Salegentibacter chungangensis]|uniref:Secreted protein n=1 Tax=Salegentibacter chungangensis TaxID=1335724 RepID=A0ABW3NQP8_9FLAO
MKKYILSLAITAICSTALVSCEDKKKEASPADAKVETNTNPKTTSNLNPEHGQPGHRCDIPVGAPLDQAKVQQTETSTGVSPLMREDYKPKTNPPHGEPGHDCSVPVGADLPQA